MYDKKTAARTIVLIPAVRPSEALSQRFLGHTDAVDLGDLMNPLDSAPPVDPHLPAAEREGAAAKRAIAAGVHPSRIRRLGIFMDAAGFLENESFEGLLINDLDTNERFRVAVIRKAEVCQCG